MGYLAKFQTTAVTCAASTGATRLVSTAGLLDYQAVTILAANSNAGTLYISGGSNATRNGIPLTKGQTLDLSGVPMGGQVFHGLDMSSVYVWSTTGTGQKVIFHYLAR
jgi:hypothetical protein